VRASQSRTVPSDPEHASIRPSRLKAMLQIWPARGRNGLPRAAPSATLHSRIDLSKLDDASVRPSGLNATLTTSAL
jgi:hypothetical protein